MNQETQMGSTLNKVILIGSNHHHTLGLVRSFGVHGIKPYGILIKTRRKFSKRSKYWADIIEINSLDDIIPTLLSQFTNEQKKPVLFPVFDEEATILDNNYDLLKGYFFLPSVFERQGELTKLMDKQRQFEISQEYGIPMLNSEICTLCDESASEIEITPPYILKPVASVEGKKIDIEICMNDKAYKAAIAKFKALGYTRILVQHYLEGCREFCCSGVISSTGACHFALVENLRKWPIGFGIGSQAKYSIDDNTNQFAERILHMAYSLGYHGPIDVEFFLDNRGCFYLNEINWRTSGRNYISLFTGIHPAYEYYLECTTGAEIENGWNRKPGFIMDEKTDFHHVVNTKDVSLKNWLHDIKNTDSFSLWYAKDLMPAICEYWRLFRIAAKGKNRKNMEHE